VVTLELAENRLNNVLGKMFDGSTDTQGINFAWEPNYLMFAELCVEETSQVQLTSVVYVEGGCYALVLD
jgi:hypothetical protein